MRKGETAADRAAKVEWIRKVSAEVGSGCRDWPWQLSYKGYGQVRWDSKNKRVGHIILELSGRTRPSDAHHQLHSCDRPSCAAPWHLRWGTNAENRAESIARARHFTKLTPAEVIAIYRSVGIGQRDLASQYGVTQRVIWQIKNGITWSRITGHQKAA